MRSSAKDTRPADEAKQLKLMSSNIKREIIDDLSAALHTLRQFLVDMSSFGLETNTRSLPPPPPCFSP
jgi:hypothetical protein